MKCEEIMKKDILCMSPRNTLEDAAIRMRDENVGFLPICDQERKVLGTLTDRDLVIRAVASRMPTSTPVENIMTREVVACRPQDDIQKAEQLMMQKHKSRIMVLDQAGRLVGVISLSDIAQVENAARAFDMLRKISEREVRV